MKTKVCFKCKAEQPVAEFYRHKMMGDGYLGKCKTCAKKDVRANRASKVEAYRAYDRHRNDVSPRPSGAGSAAKRDVASRWRSKNHEKYKAHSAVNNAVREGKMIRQPCEKCGKAAHAHHDDYSKPLDVRWLCAAHHSEHHKMLRSLPRITSVRRQESAS